MTERRAKIVFGKYEVELLIFEKGGEVYEVRGVYKVYSYGIYVNKNIDLVFVKKGKKTVEWKIFKMIVPGKLGLKVRREIWDFNNN